MANFNINNNQFYGESTVFGQYNEYNLNWNDLERDAEELFNKLDETDSLKPAVSELKTAVKGKKGQSIKKVIAKYAADFSTATFASLASEGLKTLIKISLP